MSNTWGDLTWGTNQWNNLTDVSVSVTGIPVSVNLGDETTAGEINEGWSRLTWGENGWGIAGTYLATGQQLSSNLNSVTVDAQINIGWSSDTWGYETWGTSGQLIDVTGIELSADLGSPTLSIGADVNVTGEELTSTLGDALGSATVDAAVTGQPMTATLQYQEAIVDPTGQELTANDGTAELDANTIAEVSATSPSTWGYKASWGYGVYGNQQIDTLTMSMQENNVDPAPDAEAFGQAMAIVQGEETVTGDANLSVTGQAMTANQGQAELDAVTFAAVTGQEMTVQENSVDEVTGNANVYPSGIGLTMAQGSLKTLIWNQVDTGTAPLDPPGWQEVAA